MRRLALAAAAIAVAALGAGCGSSASTAASSTSTAPFTPSSETFAAPQQTDPSGQTCDSLDSAGYCPGDDPVVLSCSTVIDSIGWANGPLSDVRAIAILSDYLTQRALALNAGTLDDSELTVMGGLATDMENYSGNQLASDSQQFASDEQSYASPGPSGDPENTAYALPVEKDILQLVKDCPHAYKLGQQMLNSGG